MLPFSAALGDPNAGSTDDTAVGFADIRTGSEENFIMTAGRRVYFSSGSSSLDDVAKETLDLQAAWLNQHTSWLIKLQGFSDDPGNTGVNVKLSDQRAKAVMDYLASKGVSPQRMWAKGYGKERLARNCPELACKAQNRRVVVNLRKEFDAAAPQYKGDAELAVAVHIACDQVDGSEVFDRQVVIRNRDLECLLQPHDQFHGRGRIENIGLRNKSVVAKALGAVSKRARQCADLLAYLLLCRFRIHGVP